MIKEASGLVCGLGVFWRALGKRVIVPAFGWRWGNKLKWLRGGAEGMHAGKAIWSGVMESERLLKG